MRESVQEESSLSWADQGHLNFLLLGLYHYLDNQEIFEDFVRWIEQWSVKLDEPR